MLPEELHDVPGELVRGVDLGGARRDPLAREVAHELANLPLLLRQGVERHRATILCGRQRGRPRENLAQELVRHVELAASPRLQAGDDVLVGDRVVQRDHDRREVDGLPQALRGRDLLPGLEIRVEQRGALRLVPLPLQREEVDEGVRDTGVASSRSTRARRRPGSTLPRWRSPCTSVAGRSELGEPAADPFGARARAAGALRSPRPPGGGAPPDRAAAARSGSSRTSSRRSRHPSARRLVGQLAPCARCSAANRRSASFSVSTGVSQPNSSSNAGKSIQPCSGSTASGAGT